jgi:hypothetical protein
MPLNPFPGFESLETHHCVTGSMLQIFRHHGIDLSEEMLLGLGSGVGFLYWHQKGLDPFIGGRANVDRPKEEGLEVTTSRRLGVGCESTYTTSRRKAEKVLLERLETGRPTMLQVDMGYLPYFDFGGEEYHFGYHVIVAGGYDPETCLVLVADRDHEFHLVPWDDLAIARASTHKPFPPRNRLYTFDFTHYHPPQPAEIRLSILEAAEGMLAPPISNLGVKGIRKAAKQVRNWPDILDPDALRRTCFNTYIFIDAAGGTGGGIFRYMYGRYLRDASEILDEPRLASIGEKFIVIGDRWQEVAQIFKRGFDLDNSAEVLADTAEPFMIIAEMEEDAWEKLKECVG